MMEAGEERYFEADQLEDIIIHYLEFGDIGNADKAVKYGLKLHPNSLQLKIKKLEILLERKEYSQAKPLLHELRERSIQSLDFLVCCAKYYSSLGNPRRSIQYCEMALKHEEEQNFIHNFIADEYMNLDDPFNALKHYQAAFRYDWADDYALENIMLCFNRLNRNDEAEAFINSCLDKDSFNDIAWYEYAQLYLNRKNYPEAIRGFNYILAICPGSIEVYANKAACYEAMEEWDKAVECYEEMLALEYTKAYTFYKIGLCYKESKQFVAALTAFQRCLREDPQYYLAMIEQSYVYEELGGMKEALHFAKEAVSYNGTNPDYLKRLAFLLIDSGSFEESAACLKSLVELEEGRFYNWYAYAEVLMLLGEYREALGVLHSGAKTHHRAELYYQMSNCYFNLKNEELGRATLTKALDLDATILDDMLLKYPFIKDEVKKVKTKKK